MINRIVLVGRLMRDVELRFTATGVAIANFTIAVDRPKRKDAEKETDFVPIVVFQKQAETCAQYLAKGRLAAIDGRLQLRSYDNRDGQKVRVAEVVAESVRFLDRGDNSGSTTQASRPARQQQSDPFDDPFGDDSQTIDIDDESLPF